MQRRGTTVCCFSHGMLTRAEREAIAKLRQRREQGHVPGTTTHTAVAERADPMVSFYSSATLTTPTTRSRLGPNHNNTHLHPRGFPQSAPLRSQNRRNLPPCPRSNRPPAHPCRQHPPQTTGNVSRARAVPVADPSDPALSPQTIKPPLRTTTHHRAINKTPAEHPQPLTHSRTHAAPYPPIKSSPRIAMEPLTPKPSSKPRHSPQPQRTRVVEAHKDQRHAAKAVQHPLTENGQKVSNSNTLKKSKSTPDKKVSGGQSNAEVKIDLRPLHVAEAPPPRVHVHVRTTTNGSEERRIRWGGRVVATGASSAFAAMTAALARRRPADRPSDVVVSPTGAMGARERPYEHTKSSNNSRGRPEMTSSAAGMSTVLKALTVLHVSRAAGARPGEDASKESRTSDDSDSLDTEKENGHSGATDERVQDRRTGRIAWASKKKIGGVVTKLTGQSVKGERFVMKARPQLSDLADANNDVYFQKLMNDERW